MASHSGSIHTSRRPFTAGNGYLVPANEAHRLDSLLLLHIRSAEMLLTGLTSSVLIFLGSPHWVRFKFLVIKTPLRWDLPVATGCYLHTSGTMGAAVKSAVNGRKSSSSCELGQEPHWEASAEFPVRQNTTCFIWNWNVQPPFFSQWSALASGHFGWDSNVCNYKWNLELKVFGRRRNFSYWKSTSSSFFAVLSNAHTHTYIYNI